LAGGPRLRDDPLLPFAPHERLDPGPALNILSRTRTETEVRSGNGQIFAGRALRRRRRNRTRILIAIGVALTLIAGVVGADYIVYRERVHPGVRVGRTSLSGQSRAEALATLGDLARRLAAAPIEFTYEGETFSASAADLGWEPDVEATAEQALRATAGRSPWEDLLNRIRSWVSPISVPWVSSFGDARDAVIASWAADVEREPREGRITMDGVAVVPHQPVPGLRIVADEVSNLAQASVFGQREGPLPLPVEELPADTTDEDVAHAAGVAERIVSGPVTARLGPIQVTFTGADLAPLVRSSLEPEPPGAGGASVPGNGGGRHDDPGEMTLVVSLRPREVANLLAPYRDQVETEATSAGIDVIDGRVRISPSRLGKRIDAALAARRLAGIARKPQRTGKIPLAEQEPDLTTAEAQGLGVKEQISSFTTYHSCCEPRVTNIHLGADVLDGTLIMPGETFSLNAVLGERTIDKGYVPAPGILNGVVVPSVGGGISQLTTTVFNAAFFGGYPITDWKAHSYYFSRYPLGREATLSWPAPDLKFVNDTEHALLIKTSYTEVSITISIYSTKIRQVVASDPVVTSRTATGFWTLVVRVIKGPGGQETGRDEYRTFYKHGAPPTEEEAEKEKESPSPEPTPTG
jgi:vancomycin resistance protein YoaR